MKVFLDDERATPEGWVRAYWPDEVIQLLKTGTVTELSLDHDLGDDERGTGYTVLLWLEEQVFVYGMRPPKLCVHSANSSARQKMEAAIKVIEGVTDEARFMAAVRAMHKTANEALRHVMLVRYPSARVERFNERHWKITAPASVLDAIKADVREHMDLSFQSLAQVDYVASDD